MGMSSYKMSINTTPTAETETMATLEAGISNIAQAINEVTEQMTYLGDEGWGTTEVVGAQFIITLTGKRKVGDTAQDYIFGKALALAEERKTNFEIEDPDGNTISGDVTIAKIGMPSGDANKSTGDISIELHFNGKPTYTAAD